jgi:hypothetical protein
VIEANSYDFTESPQNQISTLGGVIPVSYRPVANVLFPMIFKSNDVYDTGLVGNVIVSSARAFYSLEIIMLHQMILIALLDGFGLLV